MTIDDVNEMQHRYDRRKSAKLSGLYDPFSIHNILIRQHRERAVLALMKPWLGARKISDIAIAEIGCGVGGNLLHLVQLGAAPHNLIANDLLPERIRQAEANLPRSVRILSGDATHIEVEDNSLDLVYQSTVFSSILDPAARLSLASTIARWLKPGGAVLWYDFIHDNPFNEDVKGMKRAEIDRLFPDFYIRQRRTTLAPPIARRLGCTTSLLYPMLNLLPFLRTHVVCLMVKCG